MSVNDETSTRPKDRNEPQLNEPVDVALGLALEDADDDRVRELIREAQQARIVAVETEGDF